MQRPSNSALSTTGSSIDVEKEEKKNDGKSLMQGIRKRFEGLMDANKNVKVDEDILKALIMDEINIYVNRLKLDQVLRSHILLSVAQK